MKNPFAFCLINIFILGLVGFGSAAETGLRLAHIFQDGMILQQNVPVPIWGWADAGTEVSVNFAGQNKTVVTGKDGCWRVRLDPLKASTNGQTLTVSNNGGRLECGDVLIGEVWLCAGQSNMAWLLEKMLAHYPLLEKRLGQTDFPLIRFIRYPVYANAKPQTDMNPGVHGDSKWLAFNETTAMTSMTIPFYFARKLYQGLKIPIGLIQVAVGATPQTSWCPREVIDQVATDTGSKATYEHFYHKAEMYVANRKHMNTWEEYENYDSSWQQNPKGAYSDNNMRVFPCVLFNTLIHPLAPFAFQGVIWHQGEGGPFYEHAERMVAMVDYWRKLFERDFYFIWGSLVRDTKASPPISPIIKLGKNQRNLQFLQAQKLFGYNSKSIFCNFYDLGSFNSHFGPKDKAGERFALAALNCVYDKPHVFTGPQMSSATIKSGEITIQFFYAGSGLVYEPSIEGISGFALNSDQDWFWIEPTNIEKDRIIFKHDKITDNSKIYYAYHLNPHETLFNREGFPAIIFPIEMHPSGLSGGSYNNDGIELVKFTGQPDQRTWLNITHVRRNAYVFSVDSWPRDKRGSNRVRAYVPEEWQHAGARHADKTVLLSKIITDAQGRKFVELDIDTNDGAYVIYNQDKESEALREADYSRF